MRLLEEAGLPGGSELILAPVNGSDGRKTAWGPDRRCSGEVLARRCPDVLVECTASMTDARLLTQRATAPFWNEFRGTVALRAKVRQAGPPSACRHVRRRKQARCDAKPCSRKKNTWPCRRRAGQAGPASGREEQLEIRGRRFDGKARKDAAMRCVNAYEDDGTGRRKRPVGRSPWLALTASPKKPTAR